MSSRALIAALVVGVVAAVAVALSLRSTPDRTPASEPAATAPDLAAPSSRLELGIRPEGSDAARLSRDPDRPRSSATRERTPIVRPDPDAPAPPPAPPITPSAEALAESDEIQAASPSVLAAVEQSLASKRAALRSACWTGDVPAAASVPIEATYSAEGTMLAFSVGNDPGAPAVGACLRDQPNLLPATIEPPGIAVTVSTAFKLP